MSRASWSLSSPSAVVDACVAQSAGETDHPYSAEARTVLLDLSKCRIYVLFSESVKDEWARHGSKLSIRWLAAMVSRGLAVKVRDKASTHLRKTIKLVLPDPYDVLALLKDVHLLELALAYGSGVISSDERSGTLAAQVSATHRPLARVQWVSPHRPKGACRAWIAGGLSDAEIGRLGASAPRRPIRKAARRMG